MPTITNPGVIPMLIEAYLANGLDKSAAMLKIGYSKLYTQSSNCRLLFERSDVKAELRRQRVELAKNTGYSKEQASADLDEDRQLARDLRQPSAAISAINTKMRLYGMDQIAGTGIELPPDMTQEERARLQLIAKHLSTPDKAPSKHVEPRTA